MKVFRDISEIKKINGAVLTIGTFDGVHLGHQKIINRINEIKLNTGLETVLFTFDPHPRKVLFPEQKDLKLITNTNEKLDLLSRFGIDNVLVFPFNNEFAQMQPDKYISDIIVSALNTKYIVIGYDHRFGANRAGGIDTLKKLSSHYSFKVEEIPAQEINEINISSTRIRKALEEGNVEVANQFLGYPFFISGIVIGGKKIGRSIGYPTANIKIEDTDKLIPKIGVYAVKVIHQEHTYDGMLNVGYNPTTDSDHLIKVEVNIFDFDQEIYGDTIKVEFHHRIRNEEKFANLDQLKSALASDKLKALNLLHV